MAGWFTFVSATDVFAQARCTQLTQFKKEYVNLINQLKTQGNKLTVDDANGSIKAIANTSGEADNKNGKLLQEELRKHYMNALIKVAKIYQTLKSDQNFKIDKLNQTNPKVAEFFKKIDPDITSELQGGGNGNQENNLLLEGFLNQIDSVQVKGKDSEDYKLTSSDKYFLKKLITHSQDQICRSINRKEELEKQKKQGTDFSEITGDFIINSLRSMAKNSDLQKFEIEPAIKLSIDSSLAKMKNILNDRNCRDSLYGNLSGANIKKFFGPELDIQTCNYGKFLDAIQRSQYDQFDTILHFLNTNNRTHTGFTALGTSLLTSAPDKSDSTVICSKSNNGVLEVKNIPTDKSKFKCKVNGVDKTGDDCLNLVSRTQNNNFEIEITPKVGSALNEFSIEGGADCSLVINKQPETPKDDKQGPPPSKDACTQEECNSLSDNYKKYYDRGISWEKNQCIGRRVSDSEDPSEAVICKAKEPDKQPGKQQPQNQPQNKAECEAKNAPSGEDRPELKVIWNEEKGTCDPVPPKKTNEAAEVKDDVASKSSEAGNYPPQAPPARFVPVNIPQRMPYILPGMP